MFVVLATQAICTLRTPPGRYVNGSVVVVVVRGWERGRGEGEGVDKRGRKGGRLVVVVVVVVVIMIVVRG